MKSLVFLCARRIGVLAAAAAMAGGAWAAGPKAYVGNFKDNTVSVIDTEANRVVATVPVANGPDGILISADGAQVFVAGSSAAALTVITTADDRVSRSIDVGQGPQGLALTPDGKTLLVAVNGDDKVAFVDVASGAVDASVAVAKPHTIAVQPDGRLAYVASQQPGHFALAIVDLASRRVVQSLPLDKPPRDLEFSHDGRVLYLTLAGVAAVQVLDASSNRFGAPVETGVSPHIAQHYAGMAQGAVVVQGPGELLLFDPKTLAAQRHIAVGKQPHWVDIGADAKRLYVTNEGSNSVSVVDLAAPADATPVSIAVGNAPRKIAVQRTHASNHGAVGADATVSIANFAFDPTPLTVNTGQRVTWRNDDGAPHGLKFADGAPGRDVMLPGQSFTRRYDKPGTYDYVCSVHPYMTARVIVK